MNQNCYVNLSCSAPRYVSELEFVQELYMIGLWIGNISYKHDVISNELRQCYADICQNGQYEQHDVGVFKARAHKISQPSNIFLCTASCCVGKSCCVHTNNKAQYQIQKCN